MCRLLAFNTKGKLDEKVVEAFAEVARHDVLSSSPHSDGWGMSVFVYEKSWRNISYKTGLPAFEDPLYKRLPVTIEGERLVGIIHARKAGKKFLTGLSHSHPYHAKAGAYELFFAHNGSISRKFFENPSLPYTDSYLFFLEIVKRVNQGATPLEAYTEVFERAKPFSSSLNSVLISYSESEGPRVYAGYYYNKEKLREREEYYKVFRYKDYVFSSTLKYYIGNDAEELIYGDIINL
ncbi:MAG: class II glutamine amidotransferase [Candidatus Aramenus sp.]|nr:class II glutamine amidotransferase [Candidatus Aramenus sp.]